MHQVLRKAYWLSTFSETYSLPPLLVDEVITVLIACAVAVATTPLDVARTRILQRILCAYEGQRILAKFNANGSNDTDVEELRRALRDVGLGKETVRKVAKYDADASQRPGLAVHRELLLREQTAAALEDLRTRVERDGPAVLFAGATQRLLWSGICVGATSPLKARGYYWVRDGVILQLFDSVASRQNAT